MTLKSKILSCICAWVFCAWLCSDVSFASASEYTLSTLPALDSTYVDRIVTQSAITGNPVIALDFNRVTTSTCTWWNPWDSVEEVPAFYLVGSSSSYQVGLYYCFASVIRTSMWNSSTSSWDTTTAALSTDFGSTGYNMLASQEASGLDVIVSNTLEVRSLAAAYPFTYFGYTTLASNTVLLEPSLALPDLEDNIIPFASESTTSDGTPRYGFAAGVSPLVKIQLDLPECYGTLPLEGETGTGCDPYEYQLQLFQNTISFETWNVTQGMRTVSPLGYMSWQTPEASYNEYTPFVFLRLPAATSTDTSYTLKVYNADGTELIGEQNIVVGLPLAVPNNQEAINSFCDSVPHTMTGNMIGFAYDFDFHIDDICTLVIPPDNYLSAQVSGIKTNFFAKFAFLGQLSDLLNSGLILFSVVPPIPDNITFTWQSHSYTFLDFTPIADYADDLRNYSGLIMWSITIVVILQVINSAFTPSKEDDLI